MTDADPHIQTSLPCDSGTQWEEIVKYFHHLRKYILCIWFPQANLSVSYYMYIMLAGTKCNYVQLNKICVL